MIYAFDAFELDTRRIELRKDGAPVHVEPRAFQLLQLLIEERDRAVSRDDIIDTVWGGRIVSEAAISTALKSARQAVGDTGEAQRVIKTLRGLGFRFVAKVRQQAPAAPAPTAPQADLAAKKDPRPSIVVVPFDAIGADGRHPELPSAITHDVIQAMSRLRWLRVIARATAFQMTGHSAAEIRSKLGVKYSLSGTIERRGPRLVIGVELVDLAREAVIWVERFEGALDDIHQLRADIANGAVASIETHISRHEARFLQSTPTEHLDAWSAYHLGLVNMYRFTPTGTAKALHLFGRAVTLDPGFAKAHAGLSFAHFQNAFNRYDGVDVAAETQSALKTADRSLELDGLDHFGTFVRGRAAWLSGDLDQGLAWVNRSTEINPNFAQGHYTAGLLGVVTDTDVDFLGASDRATNLSPLDPLLYGFLGTRALGLMAQGHYASAADWADRSAHAPGALIVMDLIAVVANELAGRTGAARHWATRARTRRPEITQQHLFDALPFRSKPFRALATKALARHGL